MPLVIYIIYVKHSNEPDAERPDRGLIVKGYTFSPLWSLRVPLFDTAPRYIQTQCLRGF